MDMAESDVIRDQENEDYKKVYIQWWVPMRKEPIMMRNCLIIVS
jgi:hypothetical protein